MLFANQKLVKKAMKALSCYNLNPVWGFMLNITLKRKKKKKT